MKSPAMGIAFGIGAASIWGGMYVVSKLVLEIIPPFTLITMRLLLGAISLLLIMALRGRGGLQVKSFWRLFGVGTVGYGFSLGFQFIGTKLSTAANGALITSATPAFVLLFAWFILRGRITTLRVVALLLSSIGVLAVIDPGSASLAGPLFLGNLSLLAAALTWALYSVLIRLVARDREVLSISLVAFLGGLPISIPAALWEASSVRVGAVSFEVIVGVLFLGIVCTALAMVLWNSAFAMLDAGLASLTIFAQPIVGALLSSIFLHESFAPRFLLGGILIALGLVIASKQPAS